MEFKTGDFIFHREYGVGRVQSVLQPASATGKGKKENSSQISEIKVLFHGENIKDFSSELLERSAIKLSPEGFRVFAFLDPEGAQQMLENNPIEAIVLLFQDFPGLTAKTEDLKDYLAPYVIEWDAWWDKVQPKLKESERIDTTKSKLREYRLRRELFSPAEEVYQAFHRLRPFESKSIVYELARRVLEKYRESASLPEEHLQDVLEYIEQIVQNEKEELSLRLDAVFRLQEGKWINKDKSLEFLDHILVPELRLFQLNIFTLNRVVEHLINLPLTEEKKSILASSICAGEQAIKAIVDWALQRGDPDFVEQLLLTALSENLPTELAEDELASFTVRLGQTERLINGLHLESKSWEPIIAHHRDVVLSLSKLDIKSYLPLIPALIAFSDTLNHRVGLISSQLSSRVLDNLINPSLPVRYVVSVVDSAQKIKKHSQFGQKLEKKLWVKGEEREYDFLEKITNAQESELAQVRALVDALDTYKSDLLTDRIGSLVCEIVGKNEQTDPEAFLPYLNKLHDYEGKWAWTNTLEGMREKIYIEILQRPNDKLGDQALASAARQVIDSGLREMVEEINLLSNQLEREKTRTKQLENLLEEKEQVIREMRSGFGGEAADARFEERVRIVKDLAGSIAEFERMVARLSEKSREMEAVILRLNSLLAGLKVSPMDPIGTQVSFNPQKHRAVGSDSIETGENVIVFERGYLIQDHRGKTRLLKSSLVKK